MTLKKNVNPKVVAAVILIALGLVQWWWWEALVAKRSGRSGPPQGQQQAPGRALPLNIAGREDVLVETLAGSPEPGLVDGPGYAARFDGPSGLALMPDGSLLVADTRNHRIRKVGADGNTTTLTGGVPGFRDAPTERAEFMAPCSINYDPASGAITILDAGNLRIRRIAGGIVSTVRAFPNARDAASAFGAAPASPTYRVIAPPGEEGAAGLQLAAVRRTARLGQITFAADDKHSALFLLRGDSAEVAAGIFSPERRLEGWTDGPGDRARFGRIGAIVVTDSRTAYVADTTNNSIRKVTIAEGEDL